MISERLIYAWFFNVCLTGAVKVFNPHQLKGLEKK